MCPIYTDQEDGNGVLDTLHTQTHTLTRVRVLANHKDVGLFRNTGIDLTPSLPPTIQKAVQPAFFRPPAKHLVPSP